MYSTICIVVSMEAAINNISIPRTLTDMLQATLGKNLSVHCATTLVIRKGYSSVTQLCSSLNQGTLANIVVWVSNITIRYIDTDKNVSETFTGIMELM